MWSWCHVAQLHGVTAGQLDGSNGKDMQCDSKDIMKKVNVTGPQWQVGRKTSDQENIIVLEAQVKELNDLKLSIQLVKKLKLGQQG